MTDGWIFRVVGRLTAPLDGSTRIEAWERDGARSVLITAVEAAPDGSYALEFGDGAERRPDIFLRAVHDGRVVATTEQDVRWSLPPGETRIELEPSESPTAGGVVLDDLHRPVAGAEVRLSRFDRSGRRVKVGTATTDDDGRYSIPFDADAPLDLEVRVEGREPVVLYGVTGPIAQDVAPAEVPWTGPSTFERLLADVEHVTGRADVKTGDVERIVARTGADRSLVELLAEAGTVSRELALPTELAFTMAAAGLPLEPEALAATPPHALRAAVEGVVAAGSAPRAVLAQAEEAIITLRDRHVATVLDRKDEAATATLGEALAAAGIAARSAQEALLRAQHEDAVLPPAEKLALELAALTRNNPKLIGGVRDGVTNLAELAELDATGWEKLIKETGAPAPGDSSGATPAERRAAYAAEIAAQLEASFPAQALIGRAARDPELPAREEIAGFIQAHPDFALDGKPVREFLDARGEQPDAPGVEAIASLQRLLPLAPRYQPARALLEDELTSAHAIALRGEAPFVARHAATLGGEEAARGVHRMAVARADASAAMLLTLLEPIELATIRGPVAPKALIPDWETLFGSADFCECEECASVTGPAAYLTDILHFLQQRLTAQNKTALDVLLARRPDLGEIELTCANTNTTLPLVDLTNEILEAAIAPRRFAVDWDQGPPLNDGEITPELRAAFAQHDFPLPAEAEAHVIEYGRKWCIRHPGWRYVIAVAEPTLSVTPVPQTSGTSREQDANPEHVHPPAYDLLRARAHPWAMPFDLWTEEVRAFLSRMGIRRAALMADFGAGAPVVAAERLGLAPGERPLLNGGGQPRDAWSGSGSNWVQPIRAVRTLLHRAGLRYDELVEILSLRWINPGEDLRIDAIENADPHTADTNKLRIQALGAQDLDRIHRFLRLRRRLPWSARELDRALALLAGGVDDDGLVVLAEVEELRRDLGLEVADLLNLLGPIDTHRYREPKGGFAPSQFDRLFRSRAVVQPPPGHPDRFALNGAGTNLAQPPALTAVPDESEAGRAYIQETRAAVAGALGLSGSDLALLVDGPDAVLAEYAVADLDALSSLRRHALLAGALGLPMDEFLTTIRLIGLDPFVSAATAMAPTDTARLRYVVDAARRMAAGGATLAELDYMLAHRVDPRAPLEPTQEALTVELEALRTTLRAIRDDTRPLPDPTGEEMARKLVGAGWNETDARKARELLGGTVVQSAPLATLPGGLALPAGVPISFGSGALAFTGVMTDAQRTALDALSAAPQYRAAVAALHDAPRAQGAALLARPLAANGALMTAADARALFDAGRTVQERYEDVLGRLNGHLRRTLGAQAAAEMLAEALELTVPAVDVLLTRWSHDPAQPKRRLSDQFLSPAFVDADRVDATTFPDLFRARLQLDKVAFLARAWPLSPSQLETLLTHAGALGWVDPATLPLSEDDTPASVMGWLRMAAALDWQREMPGSDDSVLDLLVTALLFDPDAAGAGAAKRALRRRWARYAAWREEDLEALLGGDAPADGGLLDRGLPAAEGDWNWWADEETWLRVRRCIDATRTTGATLVACAAWSRESVTQADARNARQAARARESAAGWLDVVSPISDELRERRRQALVAELVARPPAGSGVRDADDLMGWFLIDVEMAPCMDTSRLKQAISSVQLFVQRCLLNLEPDVAVGSDPGWAQWRWMKNYRVWEAARKIFLWPENWVRPELRDDKSPAFRELEEALAQTDLDDEAATAALQTYLERLEEVAHLEVVGILEDTENPRAPATRELHVVARSRATPAGYYYRKRVDAGRWTAWERIDADLEGEHVLPVVWNGRLHLVWPIFGEFQPESDLVMPASGQKMAKPPKRLHVQLAWTQRKGGTWTPKQLTQHKLVPGESVGPDARRNISLTFSGTPNGDLAVTVRLHGAQNTRSTAKQHFRLSATSGTGYVSDESDRPVDGTQATSGFYPPVTSRIPPKVGVDSGAFHATSSSAPLTGLNGSVAEVTILGKTPGPTPFRVVNHWFPQLTITRPLVFSDAQRSFYFSPYRLPYTGPTQTNRDRLHAFAFHHPRVREFARTLRRGGLDALYERSVQTAAGTDLTSVYDPQEVIAKVLPADDVDFTYAGAYAGYNWELFFHAPLLIADRLLVNQRFEEAQRWLNRIFDPTDRSAAPAPQRYWRTRPFFEVTAAARDAEREAGTLTDPVLSDQVTVWRADPFDPHAVARMRHTAYQRATVMKYLDVLIGRADQLYRLDTIESINEATLLYVLASDILGRRPEVVEPRARPIPQTYRSIAPKLDAFSNALVAAESLVPPLEVPPLEPDDPRPPAMTLPMRYFCIPRNGRLLEYWRVVGDRLFNLRHCRNIEGVERRLALFEPPIDPAALVAASAAGVDLATALSEAAAPLPPYRFSALAQKATELCGEVKSLGSQLLTAMEKRDAEMLAALRADQELTVLQAVRGVRQLQVQEAQRSVEALDASREMTTLKRDYYAGQKFLNTWETAHLAMAAAAALLRAAAGGTEALAGAVAIVPEFKLGAPTSIGATFGGANLSGALRAASGVLGVYAGLLQEGGSLAQTMGGYERRAEEWRHQAAMAERELAQLERQRAAAQVRLAVAERELANHDLQTASAAETRDLMEGKFTNRELYDWMVGQISGLYFRSFQLAYDLAKRAERAYRYELGVDDTEFIRFGSWDSLRKGLLAGERLTHELKRMEASWLDENQRNFELTKTVSLAMLDPAALLTLRETGSCFVSLPEGLFDLDHPGHFMRRLKSVSLSIPAVAGPYANVNARLTLLSSRVRTSAAANDFTEMTTAVQSIATSHGQRDAGLFDVDFKDERYLPFEGQGAISDWRLELDPDTNRFDLRAVPDVLLHLSYTARDGGAGLREQAKRRLPKLQLAVVDVRRELASEWARFVRAPDAATHDELVLDLGRLAPFRPRGGKSKVSRVDLYARLAPKGGAAVPDLPLELLTGRTASATNLLAGKPLRPVADLGLSAAVAEPASARVPGEWILRIAGSAVPAAVRRTVSVDGADRHHLDEAGVTDLYAVVHYVPA